MNINPKQIFKVKEIDLFNPAANRISFQKNSQNTKTTNQ